MPDESTYGFSESDAEDLIQLIQQRSSEYPEIRPRGQAVPFVIHFKSQGGGIPAPTGLTMGSASCDRYDSTSAGVLSDSGVNVTVYNDGPAYPASSYGIAAKNPAGLWVVARGIMNLRLDGNNLQLTFDGITWVTWHTGVSCP